jgi:hypothetical protein
MIVAMFMVSTGSRVCTFERSCREFPAPCGNQTQACACIGLAHVSGVSEVTTQSQCRFYTLRELSLLFELSDFIYLNYTAFTKCYD